MQKEIFGYEFQFVEDIQPERDEEGRIKIYLPQQSYKDANQTNVHKHGWGPFCKFRISREWEGLTGVYLYLVEEKVKYVGEAKDFGKRVNTGYGNISQRNCFKAVRERIAGSIIGSLKRFETGRILNFTFMKQMSEEDWRKS